MAVIHQMKLNDIPFEATKRRSKTIEIRLKDSRRKSIKAGDVLEFRKISDEEILHVTVIDVRHYSSMTDLVHNELFEKTGGIYTNEAEWIDAINSYYSLEDQRIYGLIAIEISADILIERTHSREIFYALEETDIGVPPSTVIWAIVEVDEAGSFSSLLGTAFVPNAAYPVLLTAAHIFRIYEEINDRKDPLRALAPIRITKAMHPTNLRLAQLSDPNRTVINPISTIISTTEDVAMILYDPSRQLTGSQVVSKPKKTPWVGDDILLVGCQYSGDLNGRPDLKNVEIKMIRTKVKSEKGTESRIGFGPTITVSSTFPPGFSGGPAYTPDGDFIGICSNASSFIPDEGHIAVADSFQKTLLNFDDRGECFVVHPMHGEVSLGKLRVLDWLNDLDPRQKTSP